MTTTSEIQTPLPQPEAPTRGPALRTLRTLGILAQLTLAVCLFSGVPVPDAVVLGGKLLLPALLAAEAYVWLRLRRLGLSRRQAFARLVPERVARYVAHEARILASLVRWVVRRPHGVGEADGVFPHARDQAAMMYGLTFVCVAETVALSFLLARWPVVHAVLLVVDVYTVLFVLGMHAAAVTRPHVLAGGVLRVRQAAHVDIRVPVDLIAAVRRETRFTHEKKDGELNLPIGSQTSLTLELTEPVDAPKLLGAPRLVRVIRLHADDPKSLYDAVAQARTASAPAPQDAD
ncbi:hypothetical protein [Streptomyces prunicolor]|uniref:Integral membrane protein n=1 Tax=Streptomyces prunicolor TaxID=67348 RepID=A0ABU4FH09_9ACTN|nr:hypothetical protein [Streptomyces prunicolor]MCX5239338.1 hypothetical protein [Streptomyces prunicolor]MDV7218540.1 hypothetical protein [Streptomyces prunicolor]